MITPVRKLDFITRNQALEQAATDLFLRRQQGHLDAYNYSVPLFKGDRVDGANIWATFLRENPDYIIASREAELIAKVAPLIARTIGQVSELVDFGPGSIEAFDVKTRPLLDNLTPKSYRPVDLCSQFLSDIRALLSTTNPDLTTDAELSDFLSDKLKPTNAQGFIYWGGSSFSNIPTRQNKVLPIEEIEKRLRHLLKLLPHGGHCLLTLDTTNELTKLMRFYDHPQNAALTLNLLEQMERDCPAIRLDPTGWRYMPVWRADRYVFEHRIVATRPQVIDLPQERVYVGAGESFATNHSYKIPASIVQSIAQSIGWKRSVIFGDKGDVQLLLLSA